MAKQSKTSSRRQMGELIHDRRIELQLSQKVLARRVSLRQQAISDIEAGKQAIPADELPVWTKALEFTSILSFFDQRERTSLWDLMD